MTLLEIKAFTNGNFFTLGLMLIGPIGGLMLFSVLHHLRGGVISERVRQAGASVILNSFLKEYGYWWLQVPARILVALKVHPTQVTLGGMAVVLMGSALVGAGFMGLGGLAILLGSLSDMLDGIVARQRGLTSTAGEFIDSFVDRYTDFGVFIGLGVLYRHEPAILCAVVAAAFGAVVVSYARAKAEAVGVMDVPKGPMQRAERAVLLGFGIYLSPFALRLWAPLGATPWLAASICALIAVLANISAIQMARYTTAALRRRDSERHNDRARGL
jgi:CDP-diacylglycerol--glycerol-3-phosphate 3-phosphatidyltransferase